MHRRGYRRLEIELNLYGNQPPGHPYPYRPTCLPGTGSWDPLYGFWSAVSYINYSWTSSIPDEAQPYLDSNIEFDACNRNSIAVGIGEPRILPRHAYLYGISIENEDGNQTSARMDALVQPVSNDCNNFGVPAHTDCMGLNRSRTFPLEGSPPYVNFSRGWTVPACFEMRDMWPAPVTWLSGTDGPPQTYYNNCFPPYI